MIRSSIFKKHKGWKKFANGIGPDGLAFLEHALQALERILPHTTITKWTISRTSRETCIKWKEKRRSVELNVGLTLGSENYSLQATLSRKTAPKGIGNISRTLDQWREYALCDSVIKRVSSVLKESQTSQHAQSIRAISRMFDEDAIAEHLSQHHELKLDVGSLFSSLRELAEQSYEKKALTFGIVISEDTTAPEKGVSFPKDYFDSAESKRYRALSDGFRTAYEISSAGKLLGLCDLSEAGTVKNKGQHWYPEWCEYIAKRCQRKTLGICLTRQGDILVFDSGSLRFSYRCGRWQYWHHQHVWDLLRNHATTQKVEAKIRAEVVRSIYRAALDVSFRRSGGLFVLLKNQNNMRELVADGDAMGDPTGKNKRAHVHVEFDNTVKGKTVKQLPRPVLAELAGLDGAIVLNNNGRMLAYAAVLQTPKRRKLKPSEGSRTKAAVAASRYGIAVKVSSDGDITFYREGEPYLKI